jgi:uncharacterized protein
MIWLGGRGRVGRLHAYAREDMLTQTHLKATGVRQSPAQSADFWRITGYGYIRDNGHLYGEPVGGDFDLSMRVRGSYAAQYDQAGAMVRVDDRRWLKTGIEYFDGRPRLSTVITLQLGSGRPARRPGRPGPAS